MVIYPSHMIKKIIIIEDDISYDEFEEEQNSEYQKKLIA